MNSKSATVSQASPAWKASVAKYQQPSLGRSVWQLVNTLVPYAALWYLIHLALPASIWLTIPLVILAAGFHMRVFIIFHDCGHGSFFKSRTANDVVGFLTGVLTLTPYYHWRREHALHHATVGNLDGRGAGDVWTMTVQEYLSASRWQRLAYRISRNPFVLFVIGPLYLFMVKHRFPFANAPRRERNSVLWTNLGILGMAGAMSSFFGLQAYLIILTTVVLLACSAGVWLFYVQHQFEDMYWERREDWDYTSAALQGSSFYKLPKLLQWFTGSIGFHHVHHLSPLIPNYHLEPCHNADPLFQGVKPVTLLSSLKSLRYRLWDEENRRLVGFDYLQTLR